MSNTTTATAYKITAEFGRVLHVTTEQADEWLNDLPDAIEDMMMQPLRIGNDQHSSFSPLAFCAPEVIRARMAAEYFRCLIADKS